MRPAGRPARRSTCTSSERGWAWRWFWRTCECCGRGSHWRTRGWGRRGFARRNLWRCCPQARGWGSCSNWPSTLLQRLIVRRVFVLDVLDARLDNFGLGDPLLGAGLGGDGDGVLFGYDARAAHLGVFVREFGADEHELGRIVDPDQ